ncbi:MAG TPA: diguanylate cyclase [Candidatus Limnocylindria bacterium]|nr:diguanylate cyclase [Candidatus Limnocylindria bacterium]
MLRVFLLALAAALAAAGVAAYVADGLVAVAVLAGVALGALLGLAWQRVIIKRLVNEVAGTARALATGQLDELPRRKQSALLAPLTDALAQLAEALSTVQQEATNDRLTKVASRHALLSALFQEAERSARYGRPLTIAFIDIDHFKSVNDTYGHEIGDAVLRAVAGVFRQNTRDMDVVGRYGGEEFVLIFPETSIDEATAVAEKLRMLVSKASVPSGAGEMISVTVSIGLAGGHGQALRVDDLLRDADAAMYAAKSLGRNQTYVFAELDDDSMRIPRAPISPVGRARAAEVGDAARQAAEAALAAIISPLPKHRGKPSSLIAMIAVDLARRLELPEQEVERIRLAALLHDIGKVGVPEQILEKPGPLSPDEWQAVVQHPRIGQEIINRVATIKDAAAIILHHHERFSGHGYPYGLRGADIPLGARIVAIADAYDAMLCDRPYRAAVGHEEAVRELRTHAGTQFDPELVDLFCQVYAEQRPISADEPAAEPGFPMHALPLADGAAPTSPATNGTGRPRRARVRGRGGSADRQPGGAEAASA